MNDTWEHKVSGISQPTRIVDYIGDVFDMLGSRSAARKAIAAGRVKMNSEKVYPSDTIKNGDLISLTGTGIAKAKKFDFEIEQVYEDEHLIIVNKPAGIAVNGKCLGWRYKKIKISGFVAKADCSPSVRCTY